MAAGQSKKAELHVGGALRNFKEAGDGRILAKTGERDEEGKMWLEMFFHQVMEGHIR